MKNEESNYSSPEVGEARWGVNHHSWQAQGARSASLCTRQPTANRPLRPRLLSRFDIILEQAAIAKLVEHDFKLVAFNVFHPAVTKTFMINPGADSYG